MKEEYVSYEQAKALKECGFDWECDKCHSEIIPDTMREEWDEEEQRFIYYEDIEYTPIPTLSLAAKWLRDVKGIIVWVSPEFYEGEAVNDVRWYFSVQPLSNLRKASGGRGYVFYSYESALSHGISQALTLLTEKQ